MKLNAIVRKKDNSLLTLANVVGINFPVQAGIETCVISIADKTERLVFMCELESISLTVAV